MRIERGSEWHIWDFHVHTPYSRLNNGFGFDPTRDDSEEKFDEYVKTLFTKAVHKGIVAIGITDYFFIDGCFNLMFLLFRHFLFKLYLFYIYLLIDLFSIFC